MTGAVSYVVGLLHVDEQVRQALRQLPRVSIARLDAAPSKVVGRIVAADAQLRSPMSHRRCVYWEVFRDGVRVENAATGFLIRDRTGIARVELDADARVCVFRTVFSFGEREHVGEGVLREGDYVAVCGSVAFEALAADGTTYRDLPPRRAVLTARELAKDGTVMD